MFFLTIDTHSSQKSKLTQSVPCCLRSNETVIPSGTSFLPSVAKSKGLFRPKTLGKDLFVDIITAVQRTAMRTRRTRSQSLFSNNLKKPTRTPTKLIQEVCGQEYLRAATSFSVNKIRVTDGGGVSEKDESSSICCWSRCPSTNRVSSVIATSIPLHIPSISSSPFGTLHIFASSTAMTAMAIITMTSNPMFILGLHFLVITAREKTSKNKIFNLNKKSSPRLAASETTILQLQIPTLQPRRPPLQIPKVTNAMSTKALRARRRKNIFWGSDWWAVRSWIEVSINRFLVFRHPGGPTGYEKVHMTSSFEVLIGDRWGPKWGRDQSFPRFWAPGRTHGLGNRYVLSREYLFRSWLVGGEVLNWGLDQSSCLGK